MFEGPTVDILDADGVPYVVEISELAEHSNEIDPSYGTHEKIWFLIRAKE